MDAELQKIVEKLENMPFKVESEYLPARDRYNNFVSDEDRKIIQEAVATLRSYEHPLERAMKKNDVIFIQNDDTGYILSWETVDNRYEVTEPIEGEEGVTLIKATDDFSSALSALVKEGE